MKLFSRHPDDSTGSVRGGVLQAPSTYVKMRIAEKNAAILILTARMVAIG
jgi:hypothetical protein